MSKPRAASTFPADNTRVAERNLNKKLIASDCYYFLFFVFCICSAFHMLLFNLCGFQLPF